jgi:tRNA dimethylallyltransferase
VVSKRAILIAGPTASGKSALALTLAEQLGGVVINADSMQVYRDLRIITARPAAGEEARVPHRLFGHVDAAENYSVGHWCRDAAAAIEQARSEGRIPIVAGGTGLYFKALVQGLAGVPPIPADIREGVRRRLADEGIAPLHAELMRLDPAGAGRLIPGDRARITRALEVVLSTGRPIAAWHRDGTPPPAHVSDAIKIFLAVPRAELYRRIDCRFDAMLEAGALVEVRALAARELSPSLPAMKAHGVPWLIRHLAGEIGLADAAAGTKRDTRRYTKRQGTWFRHQLPDWPWMEPEEAEREIVASLTR